MLSSSGSGQEQNSTLVSWFRPAGLPLLSLKIFALKIVTFGIYSFWGKTDVRRKLWSAIHLDDQPVEYTGTGKELFIGFLFIYFMVIAPLMIILQLAPIFLIGKSPVLIGISITIFYALIFFLFGVAQYRARKYRLSRTNWRGIRGNMADSAMFYGWTYLWTTVLSIFTLYWLKPWKDIKLQKILTDNTRFGTEPLKFDGSARKLYPAFAITWFGMVGVIALMAGGVALAVHFGYLPKPGTMKEGQPLPPGTLLQIIGAYLGIALIFALLFSYYMSRLMNHIAGATSLQDARFSLDTTGRGLAWLTATNFVLVVFTIGILAPIAQSRLMGYFINRMELNGSVDFEQIAQNQEAMSKTGEGLAEAFDVDAF